MGWFTKLTNICRECGSRQVGSCPSQIPGIAVPNLLKCYCCESEGKPCLFRIDENDQEHYSNIWRLK